MPSSMYADFSVQPYQGTDVVSWALLASALICLVLRLRDGERGMGWFALSMGALALWIGANERHLPTGPQIDPSPWWYLMCLAMGAMGPGLSAYTDLNRRRQALAIAAIAGPALLFAALVAFVTLSGATLLRIWLHALTALAFTAMSAVAFSAARREPGAGYAWLGLALATVPALAVVLAASRADPVALRYWAVLPAALVGLTLPSVALLRRRQRLQAEVERRSEAEAELGRVNANLEQTVAFRTEDLRSMIGALESFNRNVAHDLRGPLGGIAGLAKMAKASLDAGDDRVAREALPLIAREAEQSMALAASLLELAKIGDVQLDRQTLDPASIVAQVIEQLRLARPQGMPAIRVGPLPLVNADPELLRAILTNLVSNAIKFTREREDPRIEIVSSKQDGEICLQVRDNGVGLSAQAKETIFSPFRRAHDGSFEGHGIGLSIVRRAVERHGGRVWAEGRPEGGASFNFTIPESA